MTTTGIDLEEEDLTQPNNPAAGGSPNPTKPMIPTDEDDVDFGNADEARRPGELELFKVPQKGTFGRFSILIHPDKPGKAFMKRGYIHYVKGKGYARCLSKHDAKGAFVGAPAFCCTSGKDGEKRYIALVVRYTSIDPKTGRFLPNHPVEFEIQALALSRIGYSDIGMLAADDEKVTDLDIVATPKEDANGLKYGRISGKASYRVNAALQAAVMEAAKPFLDGREMSRKIGRTLNSMEMKLHLGITSTAGDDLPGMDDM